MSSFLQSHFWADFKANHGWKELRFKGYEAGIEFECSLLLREFSIPFIGKINLAYVPMGIDLCKNFSDDVYKCTTYTKILSEFSCMIKQYLPKKTICIRYDVPIEFERIDDAVSFATSVEKQSRKISKKLKCTKAPYNVQPPDTVVLDLSQSEDCIFEQMKSKWRYNIRLAQKKGVQIKKCSLDEIDLFYNLYKVTAQRDGIAIHNKEYYADLLRRGCSYNFSSSEENLNSDYSVNLYIASHEDEPLAAIITLFTPKEAVYLYGASSNNKRNLMPAYLLQWTSICDAKKAGSLCYDFYGIPPTDDEKHPMHGLYRFKTGFGGRIVHRPGSIDVPLSPLYNLYVVLEKLRSFWYKTVKKRFTRR
ncbi:MAG: peptidoglycan bridge formation glycyltransferase FemA/FemB family protein [Spirochaetaceae bacterium]|nr:peptidoglycan bridge formation glycyltransferase FemA/FemB family protein [Spirochaetaceae bacterium]